MGNEPESIEAAAATCISAASLLEARIVLFARSGDASVSALDAFILKSGMTVVAVSPHMGNFAFDAYHRFGKGTGHGAALNYGDCFSYALARHLDAPLPFKGDDFSWTDIRAATDAASQNGGEV